MSNIVRKIIIITLLILTCISASAQKDREKIIKAFDKIIFYPDSTIKCVYKLKGKIEQGYSIEFGAGGQALAIGKYMKGKKQGYWVYPDNSTKYYIDGIFNPELLPSCDIGSPQNFVRLYNQLLVPAKVGSGSR